MSKLTLILAALIALSVPAFADQSSLLISGPSTVIGSSGTSTSAKAAVGTSGATNVGSIMLNDTDNAGYTECTALNGTLSCGTDADGIIDGTA